MNKAVVNEDANAKLIRELKEELEKLKSMSFYRNLIFYLERSLKFSG